jgi:hypothetical protein
LQHVRAATGPAEKALERVATQLGRAAVNNAIALLPKPRRSFPLRAAVRGHRPGGCAAGFAWCSTPRLQLPLFFG